MSPLHRFLLTGSIALLGAIPAVADSSPFALQEDPALNRAAYSALLRDDDLSDLNIGVRVLKGGTAMLWGSANPTDATKAEAVLKKVPGIVRVVNTCDPVRVADPLIARVEAAFKGAPPEPVKVAAPPVVVAGHTTAAKPSVVDAEPAARLRDPLMPVAPMDYSGIIKVRKTDPRFARLTFDLRDGRVVIAGTSSDPTAAWDLARQIAPLVGDRDVVVARGK